ncbi:cytochrome C [Undibacterium parvum]|uniref:Cytochrome C n=1 Tax=Undibacterium parvum TaxID=401471 RepID=A0A3Q9BS66_9BURK|nr:cytochrome C [Undibacterium parvum]AZP13263.1 cytochrome C [Undibacterium parvum]
MKTSLPNRRTLALPALLRLLAVAGATALPAYAAAPVAQPNEEGAALTFSSTGSIDTNNPFFKPFGNGRACASCHQESQGWSVSPAALQARFTQSNGNDPIFKLNDGANSPNATITSLEQKRAAYNLLLSKGLIRVGLAMPAAAEFTLVKVEDPYGYASAKELSLFRRPLPTTNLKFQNTVMWDARETLIDAQSKLCIIGSRPAKCFAPVDVDLLHQSNSAVTGHAQAAQGLTAAEQRAIVDFEKTLFTAQISSKVAGSLDAAGGKGGPLALAQNNFYFGINDVQEGDYQTGAAFNRAAFSLFGAWRGLDVRPPPPPAIPGRPRPPAPPPVSSTDLARASIARGEAIFNNKPFNISGVGGFNDELRRPLQRGTCTSCHNTPNVGSSSVPRLFNTGTSDARLRTPDLPLYTLKNIATGEVVQTSDPGSAMQTGKWKDIGRVKVPSLRALEARSPYFHNGSVNDLTALVKFYDKRFGIGFTPQEVVDLTEFLKVL